ncbi:MAG TPA: dihydrolipoamide acetyltransferase family protein, partial [Candidatus Hydrogenedentes bacterium]|nr:dihydrolipoamide acetyltransferase family protein [Candidatus Hydrogenedentota bacterium]
DLSQYGAGGSVPMAVQSEITVASVTPTPQSASVQPVPAGKVPVSPRARKAAAARGIDAAALAGSGVGGRVLEADVLAAAPESAAKITPTAKRMIENAGIAAAGIAGTGIGGKITKADVSQALAKPAAPAPAAAPGVASLQRVPLTPMRRIIAERMSASKYSAPHYYVTVEVDMKGAREFRARNKAFKASFNDLVLFATAKALREFPNVNARWLGDAIEQGGDVNLGMAVALPTGLIVPVIRQAHLLSLEGLCAASKALAEKAQTGKLLPDDYQGNTFTVSNLGAYGVDHFTAIINQPDSAILAIGQIKDRVVVIDGGIHIRPIMKLTLSSDHRVVDGAVAAQFMGRLKAILEEAAF